MSVRIEDIAKAFDDEGVVRTENVIFVRKVLAVLKELGVETLDGEKLKQGALNAGEAKGRASERAAAVAHLGSESYRRIAVERAQGGQQLAPIDEARMQLLEGRHDGGRRFGR